MNKPFIDWNKYLKKQEEITQQRDDLLAACRDLIEANEYARLVSFRLDESPRGSVWGGVRSRLDAAKLNAQNAIAKCKE